MKNKIKFICMAILVLALLILFNDKVYAANEFLSYGDAVSCGNLSNIPRRIPELFSALINLVQVIVPVLLVIFGVIDLIKGVMAQKEEEIKKGQQTLIKRIIMGMIIFLVIMLTKFLVSVVAEGTNNKNNIIDCIDCFVSGSCL